MFSVWFFILTVFSATKEFWDTKYTTCTKYWLYALCTFHDVDDGAGGVGTHSIQGVSFHLTITNDFKGWSNFQLELNLMCTYKSIC